MKTLPVETFKTKFQPLRKTVYTENSEFSSSKMIKDLKALIPLAKKIGSKSTEMAAVSYLLCNVLQRAQEDAKEIIKYGVLTLEINQKISCLKPKNEFYLNYWLAEAYLERGKPAEAIRCQKICVQKMDDFADLDVRQKFGVRQSLGFFLHLNRQYDQAFQNNQQLLTDAESALGKSESELTGVLTNLAQNAHALKKLDESKKYLERCLKLAIKARKTDITFETFFQLGVLAFEMNQSDAARGYFNQRVKLAEGLQDEFWVKTAKEDLKEFEAKLSKENLN